MSTLCDAVGVSGRTLAYAFQQTLGLAPTHGNRVLQVGERASLLAAQCSEDVGGEVPARVSDDDDECSLRVAARIKSSPPNFRGLRRWRLVRVRV